MCMSGSHMTEPPYKAAFCHAAGMSPHNYAIHVSQNRCLACSAVDNNQTLMEILSRKSNRIIFKLDE